MKNQRMKKRELETKISEPLKMDNINPIIKVITLLDGYRINKFKDPTKIGNSVKAGQMGNKVKRNWDKIYKSLYDLTGITSRIPNAMKYLKYHQFLNLLIGVIFSLSILMFVVTFALNISWVIGGSLFICGLGVFIILRSYFSKKIALSIDEYMQKNPETFKGHLSFIKGFVQELISDLRRFFKMARINPANHPFNLYKTDYVGIAITKNTSRRKSAYTAVIKTA